MPVFICLCEGLLSVAAHLGATDASLVLIGKAKNKRQWLAAPSIALQGRNAQTRTFSTEGTTGVEYASSVLTCVVWKLNTGVRDCGILDKIK